MTDVSLGNAQPRHAEVPLDISGVQVPKKPVNPYAPVGWQVKQRNEFDLELPSGQMCRLMRLERDDLFRLDLMQYLDTFAPMLMGQMSDEEREEKMRETMQEDPESLMNMLRAIDKIVMAATIKPRITEDPELVDYGSESDWDNPDFVATVPIENIPLMERMFIFGAAFGRSMDQLKSLWEQAEGVGSLADGASVSQDAQ